MKVNDFGKDIEEGLDRIVFDLGFEPAGQPLETKIRFINEKVSAFGFQAQALEYIRGYVDLLQKRIRFPDMQRLAAWTYLLIEQFDRTNKIDTSRHLSPRVAKPIDPLGSQPLRELLSAALRSGTSKRSYPQAVVPPEGASVFENDRYIEKSPDGGITVSVALAELLVEAREQYAWPVRKTAAESQQEVIDLEEQTKERLQDRDPEKAHWIVGKVYKWGGGRRPEAIDGATVEVKEKFEESIGNLLTGNLAEGLRVLSEQPEVGLVIATKIYRFCCLGAGAAVDRHCSYFFNSLPLHEAGEMRRCTRFKREWQKGKDGGSRLAAYSTRGYDHNLKEYLFHYLPLLTAIAESLNRRGDKYVCAASSKKKSWRPADVEMAAYQWWSRNGPS